MTANEISHTSWYFPLEDSLLEGSTTIEYYLTVPTDKRPTATPTAASLSTN